MLYQGVETAGGESDGALQAEIQAVDRRRVDPAEARLDFWRWDGLPFLTLLPKLGKAWAVWLTALILVGDLVLAIALASWLVAAVGLGLLIALQIFESSQLDRWVAEHNARLDGRIRALLAAADDETR